jgi:hypothetical protein
MSKKKQETVKVEAMLRDFVYWVRYRRARNKDSYVSKETLECAAQLVEQVLEGKKNPLPKQQGRNPDLDTMWLRFHMVYVVPLTSTNSLPRHFGDNGAFKVVGDRLQTERETVAPSVYKAFERWKTREGRQEYINWLNHREKRWATHRAGLEQREPTPCEYVLSLTANGIICKRLLGEGELREHHMVLLPSEEIDSLVDEARKRLGTKSGCEDYENWKLYCGQSPLVIRAVLSPPKTRRNRK